MNRLWLEPKQKKRKGNWRDLEQDEDGCSCPKLLKQGERLLGVWAGLGWWQGVWWIKAHTTTPVVLHWRDRSLGIPLALRSRLCRRDHPLPPSRRLEPSPSSPSPTLASAAAVAAEMSVWNYVVTAHKPTSVTHSCVGNFTGPNQLNLIVASVIYSPFLPPLALQI